MNYKDKEYVALGTANVTVEKQEYWESGDSSKKGRIGYCVTIRGDSMKHYTSEQLDQLENFVNGKNVEKPIPTIIPAPVISVAWYTDRNKAETHARLLIKAIETYIPPYLK